MRWIGLGRYGDGLRVDRSVILDPVTVERVDTEPNAEVRRVLLERWGYERYLDASGAVPVHCDEYGELYRVADGYAVSVLNATPEPDGSRRRYVLPVHPELRPLSLLTSGEVVLGEPQEPTARAAVASTFGLRAEEYAPVAQS